jgi:hypothetical protein
MINRRFILQTIFLGKFWRRWQAMKKKEVSSLESIKLGCASFSTSMGKSWKNSIFYTPEIVSPF